METTAEVVEGHVGQGKSEEFLRACGRQVTKDGVHSATFLSAIHALLSLDTVTLCVQQALSLVSS